MSKYLDLTELRTNPDYVLHNIGCRLMRDKRITNGSGRIELADNGSFRFIRKDKIREYTVDEFTVENESHDKLLREYFKRGFVNLAQVIPMQNSEPSVFRLYVVFFSAINNLSNLSIIVSDEILNQLAEKKLIRTTPDKIDDELAQMPEKFYLQDFFNSNQKLFAYIQTDSYYKISEKGENPAPDAQPDLESETLEPLNEVSEKISVPKFSSELFKSPPKKSLELFGKSFVITVGLYEDPATGQILALAQKIIFNRRNFPCMQLACGNLTFTSEKKYSSELVKNLMSRENTYVKLWKLYADKEGEFLIKKNRRINVIHYETQIQLSAENDTAEIVLTVKPESFDALNFLQKDDTLRTSSTLPVFIENPEMSWNDYQEYIFRLMQTNGQNNAQSLSDNSNFGRYEIVKIDKSTRTLTLKPLDNTALTAPSGYLFFDDVREQVQIFRRQNARERIENGTSANPHLSLIIGGDENIYSQIGGLLTAKTSKKEVAALTENVRSKIFKKHDATANQEAAIKIALNTPDIAIIQGPPGTGKTTVITAILERLNELADKKELQRGQVLITSLQHDAVKNVISRVTINSIPTVKFGTRHGEEKNLDDTVEKWCLDLAERIREKNPELRESAKLIELEQTFNFYAVNPNNDNAVAFLEKARSLVTDKDLLGEIEEQLEKINPAPVTQIQDDLITLIRRLSTTKKSFADNGAGIADALLYRLEKKLDDAEPENKKILDTLKTAAENFDEEPTKDLLKSLRECKNILLKRCIPKPNYRKQTLSPELIDLHVRIKNFLAKPVEGVNNVLYNLLNELENNPEIIRNSLKDYVFAFAATAQQSEHKEIKQIKGQQPEYDTVIVDEAARVNPGDLMIPLSQAKSRIIMVGDHRQLPHMYDEEIFERLNEEGTEINPLNIKESMFEHLIRRAKRLKAQDNIDRFITLNAQYRMHPELGNFVSRNFYEPYGEKFDSPRSAEFFYQSFEPNPMLWINLPGRSGKMTRINASPCRPCEAELIVEKIKKYRKQMTDDKHSIGVITFYRAQKDNIIARLKSCGLEDVVSVGTVDSFQGMEFDVIFLSVVRTGINLGGVDLSYIERDENSFEDENERAKFIQLKEKIGRANYGFLTSKNRLCVALSRQKRLLVVVGDADLFHGEQGSRLSKIFVPELKNFYELCAAKGAIENA